MSGVVRVRSPFGHMDLVSRDRASAADLARALPTAVAISRLESALHRRDVAEAVSSLIGACGRPAGVAEAVEGMLRSERLVAIHRELHRKVVTVEEVEPLGPSDDLSSWIGIELLDEDGEPVADEPYEVECEDGRVRRGTLNVAGRAIEEGLTPGTCRIRFPALDASAWRAA